MATKILPALLILLTACATGGGPDDDAGAYADEYADEYVGAGPASDAAPAAPSAREARAAYEAIARLGTNDEILAATMQPMADAMAPLFAPVFARANVTDPDQKDAFVALFASELTRAMQPRLLDVLYPVIEGNITPANAVAIATFFETRAGRDYLAALPAITRASGEAGGRLGQELTPQVVAAMVDKLEAGETAMDPEAAEAIAAMFRQMPQ